MHEERQDPRKQEQLAIVIYFDSEFCDVLFGLSFPGHYSSELQLCPSLVCSCLLAAKWTLSGLHTLRSPAYPLIGY